LYSGHEDGSVRCWQLPEGLELLNLPSQGEAAAESHLLDALGGK
jgi:hypothetical protein